MAKKQAVGLSKDRFKKNLGTTQETFDIVGTDFDDVKPSPTGVQAKSSTDNGVTWLDWTIISYTISANKKTISVRATHPPVTAVAAKGRVLASDTDGSLTVTVTNTAGAPASVQ